MLTENIQKKDPNLRILVHHFEFYHPATNIFQEITDSDLETLLSLKNIHVLIIEDLLLSRSSSTPAASDTLSPQSSSPFPILQIEGRAFNLNSEGIEINHLYLPIHESVEGREQGTGLNTWDGAVVLAKYLETSQGRSRIQKKHILEVGAGTGTAGLASFYLGGSLVVLTDLEYTLDNLRYNAQRAIETLHSSLPLSCSSPEEISSTSARALVLPLDWSDPATYLFPSSIDPSLPSHWDVILGADIVWLDHLVKPLVQALASLASPSTLLLLSHQTRSRQTDDLFFSQLSKHFLIEAIPREELDPQYSTPKITVYRCHPLPAPLPQESCCEFGQAESVDLE